MGELTLPWVTLVLAAVLASAASAWLPVAATRLRWIGVALRVLSLAVALGPLWRVAGGHAAALHDPWDPGTLLGGAPVLVIDALSAPLLPLVALLWLLVLVASPRASLQPERLRLLGAAELVTVATFLCRHDVALALLWTTSIALFLRDLRASSARRPYVIALRYLVPSAVLFVAGVAVRQLEARYGLPRSPWGAGLLVLAVVIRKGIVPGHSWLPEVCENGSFASAILFSTPQVGAYVAAVLVVPGAPPALLTTLGAASLVTALYGAAAALVQQDARRAFGWLFVSQSALVLAGLDCSSVEGLTGALLLWISSGIALAGIGLTVWVLEARRGRLSLARFNGGYEKAPLLAASFLLLGLASVGFPGTAGFVGQELLVDGAVQRFPHIGFATVLATALSGVAVLRMYFRLFCGAPSGPLRMQLLGRELVPFACAVALLLAGGVLPGPLVASRSSAARALLDARARTGSVEAPPAERSRPRPTHD